jgi:hypothetical protein
MVIGPARQLVTYQNPMFRQYLGPKYPRAKVCQKKFVQRCVVRVLGEFQNFRGLVNYECLQSPSVTVGNKKAGSDAHADDRMRAKHMMIRLTEELHAGIGAFLLPS